LKWFRKAAEQGKSQADVNIGIFYENGQIAEKSDTEAIHHYRHEILIHCRG
jgi:TPR repeat protein